MERIKDRDEKMKDYNEKQKNLAKTIGQNLSLYICIMIPLLMVGLIWTDAGLPTLGWSLVGDAVLTVALFVIGERSMLTVGITGGKMDDEYLDVRKTFRGIVSKVRSVGVLMLDPFCDWAIDQELIHAKKTRLRRIGIKYPDYKDNYEDKSFEELKELVGLEKAVKIAEVQKLKPIDLNPEMLMTEHYGARDRRDIPEGADEFIERKRYGVKGIVISSLTALFTVAVTLTLTQDITLARVLYTIVKLIALFYRMAKGYSNGAKAYNTMQVRNLTAKTEYLGDYLEFMEKKIYLRVADQYPDIYTFINHPTTNTDPAEGIFEKYEIPDKQPAEVAAPCSN